eukprot:05685_5
MGAAIVGEGAHNTKNQGAVSAQRIRQHGFRHFRARDVPGRTYSLNSRLDDHQAFRDFYLDSCRVEKYVGATKCTDIDGSFRLV